MMTMDIIGRSDCDSARPSILDRMVSLIAKIRRNRRTRLHLSDLSDAALEDIGISRREAEAEARRWIWP